MRRYSLILLLAIVVSGCGPKYLERSGIPVIWGMRLDEAEAEAELPKNLEFLTEQDSNGLMLELPLRSDSFGLPIVGYIPSEQSLHMLKESQTPLSLAFATTNYKELFPTNSIAAPVIWMHYLETSLDSATARFQGCNLKRVIFAADWGPMAGELKLWNDLMNHFRTKNRAVLFSFGGRKDFVETNSLANLSDEIAIDYAPIADDELKGPCRAENLKITELALAEKKPVFIFRANVIGENPELQLQNRLRFWRSEVKVNGICLNTLYSKIPPRDHTTYYGMADDPKILDFLQEYRLRASF